MRKILSLSIFIFQLSCSVTLAATKVEADALYEQEKSSFKTGKTGLCVTINWNENLRSFGIEKIFLTKEMIAKLRVVSK